MTVGTQIFIKPEGGTFFIFYASVVLSCEGGGGKGKEEGEDKGWRKGYDEGGMEEGEFETM